jgi:5-methylthioribose kinase
MNAIDAGNAADYLRSAGRVSADVPTSVRELSGGVSNVVLLVERPVRGERFVLKQARGRLRVKEEWLCPVERIWREVEVLQICGGVLAGGQRSELRGQMSEAFQPCVPEVLWEDRENYCFAMTAASEGHKTWKDLLLAGDLADGSDIAAACGRMLASLHGSTWGDAKIAARLDDRAYFDLLRIDPYYRHVAKVHPDLAPHIQRLIDSVWSHRRCLVHGDFSPKNLLVWHGSHHAPRDDGSTQSVMPAQGRVMLIDCEVGHYGDPAFDLGFFLTHLLLKAIWAAGRREYTELVGVFWSSYHSPLRHVVSNAELDELESRAMLNLAGCLLARVDGKSPVDYLNEAHRRSVRDLSRRWLVQPPTRLEQAVSQFAAGVAN